MRIAVIGDVAGHLAELREELTRLGAAGDPPRLPDDLIVVQVGDLVHRGPDSLGVVALVDGYLTAQPDQWLQLVGNHEAHYLREPVFAWPERLDAGAAATLRRWWAARQLRVAASFAVEGQEFLVTHAGLTAGFWRDVLGAPRRAAEAAAALNRLAGTQDKVLFRAGQLLSGRRSSYSAGPIWAAASTELVPSWLGGSLPFSQIHGHTSLVDWTTGRLRAGPDVARFVTWDGEAKHDCATLPGGRIIGVDPGHGHQPRRPWRAYELVTSGHGESR